MAIPFRDQDVMLCVKQPASMGSCVGVAQAQMQIHAASVPNATTVSAIKLDETTKKSFPKGYAKDPVYKKIWQSKQANEAYEVRGGLVFLKTEGNFGDCVCPTSGSFVWTKPTTCMMLPSWHTPESDSGKLQPTPLPEACWDVVFTDFITHLPVSDGFDAIMVVVDKLSKRPVYIPTHTTATAEDTAKLFFNSVIRHYGIPSTISDSDPTFTSKF
ncbi:unnamed protein product [Phytophthora fragariaefolia]|uniref:Unnamed protein product n=1 Tax=Phytophthora fragariaefolia TaxID=1490495 RepID=A0A9W7CUM7_9STRA|nr:unnamed protein product [Phytophthora fragariaefolia]